MPLETGTPGADSQLRGVGPLTVCALAWIAGSLLGDAWPDIVLWLGAATLLTLWAIGLAVAGRPRAARAWAMVALLAVSGAWMVVREHHLPADSIRHYLGENSQLVRVVGVVEREPHFQPADSGAFADFSYRPPVSLFGLRLEGIRADKTWLPVSGLLLVKLDEVEPRLRGGERIEAIGWLSRIEGPANPGELDYEQILRRRGVDARLTLRDRGNWWLSDEPTRGGSWWTSWRERLSTAASTLLLRGLDDDLVRAGFLDAIVLGRTDGELAGTYEAFRIVGLAHILSLSGAHLAILMGLIWWGLRLFVGHPARAATIVLAVLIFYLLAVPWRTPIVRAGIMAAVFALVYATGRQARAIDVLALAAMVVFVWRPGDVYDAGTQLSFIAVAGLILLTRKVSYRLYPPPIVESDDTTVRWWRRVARRLTDVVAANIVAFVIVTPLVAHHFQLMTPLSLLVSLPAAVATGALLALGYLKIAIGAISPSLGFLLVPPLGWLSDAITGTVAAIASWESAAINLPRAPSAAWTIGAMLVAAALLLGWFSGRRQALIATLIICIAWFVCDVWPHTVQRWNPFASQPPVTLHMIAVGDGSCYVVRIPETNDRGEHVLMFDCGSQMYFDVGIKSVLPTLAYLGIDRIDTLVLSHADFDHFSGTLDVADGVTIGRVLMPPQMLREAEERPGSATAYLIEGLRQRGLPIETVSRGWHELHGDVTLELLWPPEDYIGANSNESSAVLAIATAQRRLLLCGDIQQQAMTALLRRGEHLQADVCDIPHHGSFVEAAPAFLTAVSPTVVLQSSGPGRLYHDRWQPFFERTPVTRLITDRCGMVSVYVERDGRLWWETFRK